MIAINIFITKYLRNKLNNLPPLTKLEVNATTKMCNDDDRADDLDDTNYSNNSSSCGGGGGSSNHISNTSE